MAVTESLLRIAREHAEKAGARKVTELVVVIGQLSSFVDDSIQFYWDLIARGTVCEGARLRFERVPARFRCSDCSTEYPLEGELEACPSCKGSRVEIVAGLEFRLDSIVVEEKEGEEER